NAKVINVNGITFTTNRSLAFLASANNGIITVSDTAAITSNAGASGVLGFLTGPSGIFTKQGDGTIDAGAATLLIGADTLNITNRTAAAFIKGTGDLAFTGTIDAADSGGGFTALNGLTVANSGAASVTSTALSKFSSFNRVLIGFDGLSVGQNFL